MITHVHDEELKSESVTLALLEPDMNPHDGTKQGDGPTTLSGEYALAFAVSPQGP